VSVERKFKIALDETRLLILGAQILFGFEFNAVFQPGFQRLSQTSRLLDALALLLIALAIALLIAPGTQHRLAYDGKITARLQHAATVFAGWALVPVALSLGLDIYIVLGKAFGFAVGATAGVFFTLLALLFWYGLEFGYRAIVLSGGEMGEKEEEHATPLQVKIDQMLTEARIAIPGAQALLGFQLLVALNTVFSQLPKSSQIVHGISLGAVALSLVLLIAPAAFHRLAFRGADCEPVLRYGSRFVTAALLPLAFGISGDIYVAVTRLAGASAAGLCSAAAALLLFLGFWYVQPLMLHRRRTH
jgi:hypothetical protein